MTAVLGWALIVALFGGVSLVALWPLYRRATRRHPQAGGLIWAYAAAAAALGVGLWFAVPPGVHALWGHVAP